MLNFRKSKLGFTLIELMVVVAIIGVLALLGLRLYSGQQQKAKNAIVKANAGTIQTLLQAELADAPFASVVLMLTSADNVFTKSGIHVPDGGTQDANGTAMGEVVVSVSTTDEIFWVNGYAFLTGNVYVDPLSARK